MGQELKNRIERDAARYRWMRTNLNHVNFEGLTTDTCDVGLDFAIDLAIRRSTESGRTLETGRSEEGFPTNELKPWERDTHKLWLKHVDIDHCPKCGEYLHDEMGHMCS
jgi:hypothetical protein